MATREVLYDLRGGTAWITLNRPQRRNALNQALLAALYDVLEAAAADAAVRVVVITGAGSAFCAGLDLKVIGTENLIDPRGDGSDLPDVLARLGKPLIGAINGPAVTGGFELALNCDFLIASTEAAFADTHVKVGIHPGWGMSQLLQEAVGRRMALQLSLTGAWIDAQRALATGLVNEVVPPGQLLERAREVAGMIAANDPLMVATLRRLIRSRAGATLGQALEAERAGFRRFLARHGKLGG
ncbi:MAG TPA: enoyl-CoA hydratase [Desulfobacteraceae bacterium]|nr:enoyl-CoA hydratase [Deltaproteobacteria bacterium]MBW2355170.1 enoyl-CoA hydratase [Deltaproteobacteria bacterium]RLB98602.1 MAG: enoyl-CoA hydratase [Deltaproteobacteria bacterium]HDI59376.1 enoyl-CoA hydratase [Desulfobacteraceae bacterium]